MYAPTEDLVEAVEWITANAQLPAVISMSISSVPEYDPNSKRLRKAIEHAILANISVVLSGGNADMDPCKMIPASIDGVITVGAIDSKDRRPDWSTFGECLSIFAPGVDIFSSSLDGGYKIMSGTSQAAPFVAGVAALYLEAYPSATPKDVKEALIGASLKDKVRNSKSSPGGILQTVFI